MAEKVKNTSRINFYEEKKWIMAYWFKTSRKEQFTEMYLWELWQKWFGKDFNQCHLLNENSDIMSEFFFSTSNPNFLIIT